MSKKKAKMKKLFEVAGLLVVLGVLAYRFISHPIKESTLQAPNSPAYSQKAGQLVASEPAEILSLYETGALSRQYYGSIVKPRYAITKQKIQYISSDPKGGTYKVTARVYLPQELPTGRKVPIMSISPGTTGMGDQCAASLENVKVADWANYPSHLAAYASQGMAVVSTDYEGMGDTTRLHHYMVGELEARAVLDSIRALKGMPQAKAIVDTNQVYLAGYSQGGHAAFWADQIAAKYSSELKIKGVIGFGPVMDPGRTLTDITRGSLLGWFGPLTIASFNDYYKNYPIERIFLPKYSGDLTTAATSQCVDTLAKYWGRNPAGIYTDQFIEALKSGDLSGFGTLAENLAANRTGSQNTSSAKLINQGGLDNIVLPGQQEEAKVRLCAAKGGPVRLKIYATATHYSTMAQSFSDVMSWIQKITSGQPLESDCNTPTN